MARLRKLTPLGNICLERKELLVNAYRHFMNKANVLIMEGKSGIRNHKIPAKGNRLLVVDIDLFTVIKPQSLITLWMSGCQSGMKSLAKIKTAASIGLDEKSNVYCFSNETVAIDIPKLSQTEISSYIYEFDFFNEKRIYLFPVDTDNDSAADVIGRQRKLQTSLIEDCVLVLFDKTKPIDLLIRKGYLYGFQQGGNLISTDKGQPALRADADFILRSHNFYHFNPKYLNEGKSLLEVIQNYDNEFWLTITGSFGDDRYGNLKTYEHLELLQS